MNEMLAASTWVLICAAAFLAAFVDSIVGGGGLIPTPVLLFSFPQTQVANLLGTTKIPSFCGTSIAAFHYSRKVAIQWRLVAFIAVAAFAAAPAGSHMVTLVRNDVIKPVILVVLVAVAIYTYTKKNLGVLQ